MAKDTDDDDSIRRVSPTIGVKRERLDDEEESSRRVSQRTETSNEEEEKEVEEEKNETRSLKQLVLEDLRSDDKEVLEEVLKKISIILYDKEDAEVEKNQHEMFLLGGHVIVVKVMQDHSNCEGIQTGGILVINNTAYNNKDLQAAITKVDGMETIMAAMKRFHSNQKIQEDAWA